MPRVAFSAHISTPTPTNLTKGSVVIFNNVLSNMGNGYDKTSGSFKAPVHGLYYLHLYIMKSDGRDMSCVAMYVNDKRICTANPQSTSWRNVAACTAIIELNFQDIVKVRAVTYGHLHTNDKDNENHHGLVGFLYTTYS